MYTGNNPVNYTDPTGHCRHEGEARIWWDPSTWFSCDNPINQLWGLMGQGDALNNCYHGGPCGDAGYWDKSISEGNKPPESAAYEEFIGGRSGQSYYVKGVKFDAYKDGVLREAKANYNQFIDPKTGEFYTWFQNSKTGVPGMIDQARRQIAAAQGSAIEWHFNQQEALELVKDAMIKAGVDIDKITFVFTPMP